MDRPSRYRLKHLQATCRADELICTDLWLPEPAMEILEWRKTVLIDRAVVIAENVIIEGRLRIRCIFATLDAGEAPPALGSPQVRSGLLVTAIGRMLVGTADLAFTARLKAPDAEPGMQVTVTEAFVSGDSPATLQEKATGLILAVRDESVVTLAARVVAPHEHAGDAKPKRAYLWDHPPCELVPRKARRK